MKTFIKLFRSTKAGPSPARPPALREELPDLLLFVPQEAVESSYVRVVHEHRVVDDRVVVDAFGRGNL